MLPSSTMRKLSVTAHNKAFDNISHQIKYDLSFGDLVSKSSGIKAILGQLQNWLNFLTVIEFTVKK